MLVPSGKYCWNCKNQVDPPTESDLLKLFEAGTCPRCKGNMFGEPLKGVDKATFTSTMPPEELKSLYEDLHSDKSDRAMLVSSNDPVELRSTYKQWYSSNQFLDPPSLNYESNSSKYPRKRGIIGRLLSWLRRR